ncbi:MAG: hypothetical protein WDW38_002318 [Sanguina aurantia]
MRSGGDFQADEVPAYREAVTTYQQAVQMAAAQTRSDLLQAESVWGATEASHQAAAPSSSGELVAFWTEMGLAAGAASRLTQQLLSDYNKGLSTNPHSAADPDTRRPPGESAPFPRPTLQPSPVSGPDPSRGSASTPSNQSSLPTASTPSAAGTPTTDSGNHHHDHPPPTVSRLGALLQRWQRVLPGADIASLAATDSRLLEADPCRAINNVVTIISALPGVDPLSVIAGHVPILWATDLADRIPRIARRLQGLHPSHDTHVVNEILADSPGLLWRLDYYPDARLLDELPMEVQNAMVLGDSGLGFLYRHYAAGTDDTGR